MVRSFHSRGRVSVLLTVAFVIASLFAVIPAQAEPGVPPDITGINQSDQDIDPGETRFYKVAATGVDSPATATFSGTGLTATIVRYGPTQVRLSVTADASAEGGLRDLTITNPDALSDTLVGAITVTGDAPPPDLGDLTGHVFEDLDGNGAEDGADAGLGGVSVDVTDADGTSFSATTDGSGNFALTDLAVGAADVDFTTPGGFALTTANANQTVTIVVDSSVAAADVGYTAIPSGDITGHVFEDGDGNGIEDGADSGLAGVAVSVTDFNGSVVGTTTDGSGNYTVTGLATGDADVTYTTPSGYTLTTANGTQTVTVTDGGVAAAAAVGYTPPVGTPPNITSINESDQDIDPGETRFYKIGATDVVDGATVTFSGDGLTGTIARLQSTQVRLSITASALASGGLRDLTITNPDGLSDTFVGAILVTGDGTPPDTGDITGRVFEDLDGDGIENGAETGLDGVDVTITDDLGAVHSATTDASGDYTAVGVAVGDADVVVTTPPGHTLTTGNATQTVTVVLDSSVAAADVGYQPGAPDYEDVTAAAGLTLSHTADNSCGPPIGVGAAWADVDNDGDQDLYTTDQLGANHMYRNDGDTNADGVPDFTDIAAGLGIDAAGTKSYAAVFADIDNDGDQDLFVGDDLGNTLWENQLADSGSLAFTNISGTAGVTDAGRVETATFGDVDNDGYLDLYIAKHMTCLGDNIDHLYHNNGDNTFSDWTTYLCDGVGSTCDDVSGLGFTAAIFDYDQDGWQDIYLVNDNITNSWQPNKMWMGGGPDGSGGWVFTEVGGITNTDLSVNGMGLGLGDYNNDGWVDLAFSDAAPGHLLANNGNGTFADVSSSSGVTAETSGDTGWGTAFVDYDNDGWQDLFFANGSIGTPAALANSLLRSNGDGTFTNVSDATGMNNEERGRAVAVADYDGNGFADVFVGNYDAPPALMQNNSDDNGNVNNWLTVTVEGTESNRDGIGTELVLTTSHGVNRQVITSGSNHGSGSQKAAFFGLGADTSGSLTVHWPNGASSPIGAVAAGQLLHLVEPVTSSGDVTGHVFEDLDGDGTENGADGGLVGVTVTVTDALGGVEVATTDASGDFTATGLAAGDADVVYSTPGGYALTTGNATQTVAVVDGGSVAAADVGYEPIPSGDLTGHVFADLDGNGVEDGTETGLAGVAVSATAFNGSVFNATTDGSGDFTVTGLAVGDADVVFATPTGYTLTTANAAQTVAVTDSATASAADVGYQPPSGTAPEITSINESDQDIDPGETRFYKIGVSNVDPAATFTLSGDGVTATVARWGETQVRLSVTATGTASAGPRDLTVINPDGLTDTFAGAISVTGSTPPPGDGSFEDVAAAAGLVLSHTVDTSCGPPIGIGAAWADIDNDGDQDLYTTDQLGSNHLYRNDGDTNADGIPNFTDIAVSLGMDAAGTKSYAAVFADIDNDGDQDLFVSDDLGNTVWENQFANGGSLTFTNVSGTAGLTDAGRVETATFGDFDNDGFVDLYLAKHMTCLGDNVDHLFHNDGDGTFTDWTTHLCDGVGSTCDDVSGLGFAAEMFDYDNDGDLDIYLVNDNIGGTNQPNKLWRNDGTDGAGGWEFVEVGATNGSGLSVNGMGLGVGDYNNDGLLDIAFSDAGPGHLLVNDGDGTFTDVSGSSGVSAETAADTGWGTAFLDFNNDGWEDLFYAVGLINGGDGLNNSLLQNNANGTFTNVATATGMDDSKRARGVTKVDFDGDGWVDVFVTNFDNAPILMRNTSADDGNTNTSLVVTVEGTESTADALGTALVLTSAAGTQRQLISSGPSHGGGSQKAAFFGLGAVGSGTLTVEWPNGVVENLGTVTAGTLHLVEPTS